jgi:hypothetical protein
MKKSVLVMISAFVLVSVFHPGPAAAKDNPGVMVGDSMIMTATVEAIDKADREVTLRGPAGDIATIEVDKAVKNFDQIKVGDEVHAEYYQSVAVFIGKPGDDPGATAGVAVATAKKGQKPGAVTVETTDVIVAIRAIDRDNRTVTVQGPHGHLMTMGVDQQVKAYDQLKVSDTVQIRYTEAVAIWVTKAKPSATIEIDEVQVAFIASGNFGKGKLHYKGKTYPIEVGGLGVGGIGISTIEATGDIWGLKDINDFSGVYGQLRAGAVVANLSIGKLWLSNTKGVKMSLSAKRKGVMLSIGADGLVMKIKK